MAKKNNNENNLSFEKEIKAIRNKLKLMIDEMSDGQLLTLLALMISSPDELDEGWEDEARKFYGEDDDYDDDDALPF